MATAAFLDAILSALSDAVAALAASISAAFLDANISALLSAKSALAVAVLAFLGPLGLAIPST